MKKYISVIAVALAISTAANADVWRWVDAAGNTHYVDTNTPIFTWVDEFGKAHYSDTPEHEDAIAVELFWHSAGTLNDLDAPLDLSEEDGPLPGETAQQYAERKQAEAYYCKRATEIYDSYVNAPQLYRTGEDGEREYLSKQEKAEKIVETRTKKEELCQ